MLRLLIRDITVVKGPKAACDCKSAGKEARSKRSRYTCSRTTQKQFAIPTRSLTKYALWAKRYDDEEDRRLAQLRTSEELNR